MELIHIYKKIKQNSVIQKKKQERKRKKKKPLKKLLRKRSKLPQPKKPLQSPRPSNPPRKEESAVSSKLRSQRSGVNMFWAAMVPKRSIVPALFTGVWNKPVYPRPGWVHPAIQKRRTGRRLPPTAMLKKAISCFSAMMNRLLSATPGSILEAAWWSTLPRVTEKSSSGQFPPTGKVIL